MPETLSRRSLLSRALGASGGLALLALAFDAPPAWVPPELARRGLLRPPGSAAEPEFLARCIRCTRCAEACAMRAIRLAPAWAGRAAHTPHIVPEQAPCDLCLECGKVCPTGAILPLARKADARMGTAVVDERLCVGHNGTGVCGSCYTVCPLRGKAITQGAHNAPEVVPERCAGCGLCEDACIVRDALAGRAIRVRSERRWDA